MALLKFPARGRATKIVATLGPASSSPEQIRSLFEAGADVFRLNFSHGTQEDHRARFEAVRALEKQVGRPIAILADLQGPKLRIGSFGGGRVSLSPGQTFRLDLSSVPGNARRVGLPHPEIFAALSEGLSLLLDDGKVRLEVVRCGADFAETIVRAGSGLSDRKGVNVPGAVLPLSALTEKDRRDLEFALGLGADWIALSFVQRPEDVREAAALIKGRAALMAKIEKPSAIESLVDILEIVDGAMVARGDLGVEMPAEDVPRLQRLILREGRRRAKPVIVATQMLESMISSPTPTRAEASDVATAVYEGADAIMLSAETASGSYPVEAVRIMSKIAVRTQEDSSYFPALAFHHPGSGVSAAEAVTSAACEVANALSASAIVTYTASGLTTLLAARERPRQPVLALTPSGALARRLALSFGVHPLPTADFSTFHDVVQKAVQMTLEDGIGFHGQSIVLTAGVPFGKPGSTNLLRVVRIDEEEGGGLLPSPSNAD